MLNLVDEIVVDAAFGGCGLCCIFSEVAQTALSLVGCDAFNAGQKCPDECVAQDAFAETDTQIFQNDSDDVFRFDGFGLCEQFDDSGDFFVGAVTAFEFGYFLQVLEDFVDGEFLLE